MKYLGEFIVFKFSILNWKKIPDKNDNVQTIMDIVWKINIYRDLYMVKDSKSLPNFEILTKDI